MRPPSWATPKRNQLLSSQGRGCWVYSRLRSLRLELVPEEDSRRTSKGNRKELLSPIILKTGPSSLGAPTGSAPTHLPPLNRQPCALGSVDHRGGRMALALESSRALDHNKPSGIAGLRTWQ